MCKDECNGCGLLVKGVIYAPPWLVVVVIWVLTHR